MQNVLIGIPGLSDLIVSRKMAAFQHQGKKWKNVYQALCVAEKSLYHIWYIRERDALIVFRDWSSASHWPKSSALEDVL